MTYRDSEDFGKESSTWWRKLTGAVRIMFVEFSDGDRWQLRGQKGESPRSGFFNGIGIYARPPESGSAQVILVNFGGPKSHAIAAARDEVTRAAMAGDIAAGETMVYTDKVCLFLRADGTIEARSKDGEAKRLATVDELNTLRDFVVSHIHLAPGGNTGGALVNPAGGSPPVPGEFSGTSVFRAE
jgi:phage gp45-like